MLDIGGAFSFTLWHVFLQVGLNWRRLQPADKHHHDVRQALAPQDAINSVVFQAIHVKLPNGVYGKDSFFAHRLQAAAPASEIVESCDFDRTT